MGVGLCVEGMLSMEVCTHLHTHTAMRIKRGPRGAWVAYLVAWVAYLVISNS